MATYLESLSVVLVILVVVSVIRRAPTIWDPSARPLEIDTMTRSALAAALRQRLLARHLVPADRLQSIPDDKVIRSYVTCNNCGAVWLQGPALDALIESVESAVEFLDRIPSHEHAN